MSSFPRMFADSTLKRMYKKLTISDETVNLLHQYFKAFSNFYELIPLKMAYDIFKKQNGEIVSKEQFIEFSEIARHETHFYYILGDDELYSGCPKSEPFDREIVHECLVITARHFYYEMVDAKCGKPYFIPTKTELLNYSDDFYLEENKYFNAIVDFFHKDLKKQPDEAFDLASDVELFVRHGGCDIQEIMDNLQRQKIIFNMSQLRKFVLLHQELHNNTKTPFNNGFSPIELRKHMGRENNELKISFGKNITAGLQNGDSEMAKPLQPMSDLDVLSEDAMNLLRSNIISHNISSKKIGGNEPCPCGSGKKYKKCCGNK